MGFIKRLSDLFWLGLGLICLGLSLNSLLNLAEARLYLLDIFSQPLLTLGLMLCLLLALMKRPLALGTTLLGCCLLFISLWLQIAPYSPKLSHASSPISIAFANLWVGNENPERFVEWVKQTKPDIVTTIENSPQSVQALKSLYGAYPFRHRHGETFILSKFEIITDKHSKTMSLSTYGIKTDEVEFDLSIVHLTRPWPYAPPSAQLDQIERLSAWIGANSSRPEVLLGDFNATPAAHNLRDFAQRSGLSPAPSALGTWPDALPAQLRISIDNGFISQEGKFTKRQVGPNSGSDHRPVRYEVSFEAPKG